MGRMEDTRQGERMEKLCHETGRDESEQNQTIRGRGDGNVRPSERIGEGIAGETIQISVYPDHVVFWNAGRLPEDWTTARLFEKHPSKPYNPSIANALFRCGDIESWGRGYKRIVEAVTAHKLLPPVVEVLSGLMITYYMDIRTQLKVKNLNEKYAPVIEYVMENGRVTNADVQKIMNTSRATAYRILQQMDNWLEMQGTTGKSTYYVLKVL